MDYKASSRGIGRKIKRKNCGIKNISRIKLIRIKINSFKRSYQINI
jgi:hypothetical protein